MPDSKIKNLAASIRQRLLNLAQERNATRDADFLAQGDNSPERFIRIFQEISTIEVEDDGLRFDPKTVKAERIIEDADYEGVRVTFTAFLEKAQIPIQIDIGFGDTIKPGPVETDYPTLLDLPSPRLLTYPRETVVSEKLEAMVKLGIANTRMKDFHDLHSLSKAFEFDGKALADAVRATFERRGTALPDRGTPLAFTSEFYEDENKIKQWKAFCNKNKARVQEIEFKTLIDRLASFLTPVIRSAHNELALDSKWTSKSGWQPLPPN